MNRQKVGVAMLTGVLSGMKRKVGGFKGAKRVIALVSVQRIKVRQRISGYLAHIGNKLNLSMWSAFK
ncbi:MAG: hypothetical protein VX061_01895 [Pseudomonadota bacterium]|nr:hypothetical protein [Pseudomonadota bacterium]